MRETETPILAVAIESGPPALLSTVHAAARLGLRPCTLEKWRTTGSGPKFVKLGRAVRYRVADLDQFATDRLRAHTAQLKLSA